MASRSRSLLLILVAVVVLIVVAVAALPLFLNTDSIRARIESTLTKSLGRKVVIQKAQLSVLSGGLLAQNVSIADDPHFGSQPFVQAESLKVHVALWPLITRKQIQVSGFVLDAPQVKLIQAANGQWNYATIGKAAGSPAAHDEESKSTFPDLTIGELQIKDGRAVVTTEAQPARAVAAGSRVYDKVNVDVKKFSFSSSFPFTASVSLPGAGTISIDGSAGPVNQADASATPFSGHVLAKHIDPLAAGLVDASSGLSGALESLTLDASWTGQQLHVTKLQVDGPRFTLVRSRTPKAAKQAEASAKSPLQQLTVDSAEVSNGSLTMTTMGQSGPPAVYQNIHATLNNLTATNASPFTLSAELPGGGQLSSNGKVGPYNAGNNTETPLQAQVSVKHLDLQTSGMIAPDAGVGGTANANAQIVSNGQILKANGQAQIDGVRLAKTGTPSQKPVNVDFALNQNEQALTGNIEHATITIGHAVIGIAGTYQTSGATTALNMKVNGQAMPVDELEAFLPALGVKLPSGSRLQGGTLTTQLNVSGSSANPILTGPVRLDNTQLQGFDLASKLHMLTQLTGASPSSVTQVKLLSMELRDQGPVIETDKLLLDMPGLGTATGSGGVGAGGALNYHVILKPLLFGKSAGGTAAPAAPAAPAAGSNGGALGSLSGLLGGSGGGASGGLLGKALGGGLKNGIPVAITGTTSNPVFTPSIGGMATTLGAGAAQGFLPKDQSGAAAAGTSAAPSTKNVGDSVKGALGGLLGKPN